MPNNNSKLNTILLVILILAIAFCAWKLVNNGKEVKNNASIPTGQTQTNQNPTGADYQPNQQQSQSNIDPTASWKTYTYNGTTFKYPPTWSVTENHDRLYGQDPNHKKAIGLTISPPPSLVSAGGYPQSIHLSANQYFSERDVLTLFNIVVDGAYLGSAIMYEDAYPTVKTVKNINFGLGNGSKFMPELQTVFEQVTNSVK